MSMLRSVTRRTGLAAPSAVRDRAAFSSCPARPQLKEGDHGVDQASSVERHKQDLLQKQKAGKGHWKPELATNSEEAVKSDRETSDASPEGMRKLQERTKAQAEDRAKHGTSQSE